MTTTSALLKLLNTEGKCNHPECGNNKDLEILKTVLGARQQDVAIPPENLPKVFEGLADGSCLQDVIRFVNNKDEFIIFGEQLLELFLKSL